MFIQPKYVLSSLSGTSYHIIKQPRNYSIKAQNVDKMVLVKRWCQLKAESGPGAQVYFLVLLDFLKYVFVNLLLPAATTITTTPTASSPAYYRLCFCYYYGYCHKSIISHTKKYIPRYRLRLGILPKPLKGAVARQTKYFLSSSDLATMNTNTTFDTDLFYEPQRKHRIPHYQTAVTVLQEICKQLRSPNILQLMTNFINVVICLFYALQPLQACRSIQPVKKHVYYGSRAVLLSDCTTS